MSDRNIHDAVQSAEWRLAGKCIECGRFPINHRKSCTIHKDEITKLFHKLSRLIDQYHGPNAN